MDGTAATIPNVPQANGQAAPAQQAQAPAVNPTFQQPPTGAPGGPPIPPTIPLTVEEYQRLRGAERQLSEFQQQQQQAVEAAEQARIKALAEKGEVERALEEHRRLWQDKEQQALQKYATLETQVVQKDADTLVTSLIAERQVAGETPEIRAERTKILKSFLMPEIDSSRDPDGRFVHRDKASGRPAADVIRERLSAEALANFFAATSRGGSGTDGTRPPANPQTQPGSLEAIAAEFAARQGQYPAFGLGPRTN